MGTIAAHIQSYMDFATVNGAVQDGGTWVLLAGPIVIALLGLYVVWNLVAASVSGAKGVARLASRVFTRPVIVATPAPALAETAPIARVAPVAPVAPVAAIARPPVASVRRAEALARSAA